MDDRIIKKAKELIQLLEDCGYDTNGAVYKKHLTINVDNRTELMEISNNLNFCIHEKTEFDKVKDKAHKILAIDNKAEFRRQLRNLCYRLMVTEVNK